MKLTALTILSLPLLAFGCGREDRGDSARRTPAIAPPHGVGATNVRAQFVRVAELEIDPARLESYQAAVQEEMETSIQVEPGVLAIYAVAEKDNPARLRFFEMYADEAAYKSHIESPHFRKYVAATQAMVVSRRLIDTVIVQLSAKK